MRNLVFLVIISGAVGSYGSVCAADAAHCAVDVGAPIIKVADQSAGESDTTLLTIAGGQITELGDAHGLRGLFLRNGQEFQVLYATPDGQATIAGVMWDSSGKNLTPKPIMLRDRANAMFYVVVDLRVERLDQENVSRMLFFREPVEISLM